MPRDDVPLFLGEATVSLFYQSADGVAVTSAPIWFGAKASQVRLNKTRESFRQSSTGARGITTYQGNSIYRVEIGSVWVLPIQNGIAEAVMTEFEPQRNQRYVMQFAWLEELTHLTHQRIYFGVVFESENLNSRGALQFDSRLNCSAEWMESNPCGGPNPNLAVVVKVPLVQGQPTVTINTLTLPFVPSDATGYTEGNANIWATAAPGTLGTAGATFNLSGAPIDGSQVLVATFYNYVPEV